MEERILPRSGDLAAPTGVQAPVTQAEGVVMGLQGPERGPDVLGRNACGHVEQRGLVEVVGLLELLLEEPRLDGGQGDEAFHQALRRKRTTIKRALLDQSLISGVGNIYADEALWRSRLHYERPTAAFTRPRSLELLGHVRDVMNAALAVGGTSFDSLYVNVNGESGYFDRSLDAYGREGLPCKRCGTPMRRRPWMNRSSYFCPKCQRAPRVAS